MAMVLFLLMIAMDSCRSPREEKNLENSDLFELIDNQKAGIDFINQVEYTEEYNTYTYRNFYNGAGVGLGDFNNDGLTDIYFCGNLVDNRLYLNKGDLKFENITEKAGVACTGVWSTGVSIADVNGDGLLDIYVCKSGIMTMQNRQNELFINNGDLTFTERAGEYGIDITGLSTHAAFFDYDQDGDLDLYLLNNAMRSVGGFAKTRNQRNIRDPEGGNKFFRNDGSRFTDISEEAGIYGSRIGFGLGVTVGDIDHDGWADIYVSNDFFEKDYLYMNNHDGTFTENLESCIRELSLGSMGADMADINNDGYPEIFVTEMTPEPEERYKTKAMFEDWETYQKGLDSGYYRQFARNVLQLNNGNGSFSEIGRYAGVSTTDWSWGALIFDMDNDGWKDLFVANGIFKDLLDQDYINFYSDPAIVRNLIRNQEHAILTMINDMPSVRVPNYAFRNNRDLTFTNVASTCGLGTPSHSNGAVYGDLDNDGDPDLVVNNVNMPPFIYRNMSSENLGHSFISFRLRGDKKNSGAIGSKVTIYCQGEKFYQELMPMRGFQSTVDSRLLFGLGDHSRIDSVLVEWPDNRTTRLYNLEVNNELMLDIAAVEENNEILIHKMNRPLLKDVTDQGIIRYLHIENKFSDFDVSPMVFLMTSTEGPEMMVGDLDGNGMEDLVITGSRGEPASIFSQQKDRRMIMDNISVFEQDRISEDTDCRLFDADNDHDLDLYIARGGYEFPSSSPALIDRLYFNDGSGNFTMSEQIFPGTRFESSACTRDADFDGDGDRDLAVGIRLKPFSYGLPAGAYLLENDGSGKFKNVTDERAPEMKALGMITDMAWADLDSDGDEDLLVVGEFMPVTVFINNRGKLENQTEPYGLGNTSGLWRVIEKSDFDRDGDMDFIIGNHGLNSFLKATDAEPVQLYVSDFDRNGYLDQFLCRYNSGKSYPFILQPDLVRHIPSLKNKYPDNKSYKDQTIGDIFGPDRLEQAVKISAVHLSSSLLVNDGNGSLMVKALPSEVQFAPIYAIHATDVDDDGNIDILLGGNLYEAKPQTGIYDATYGVLLRGNGNGDFVTLPYAESGFFVKGQIRDIEELSIGSQNLLLVAMNNDSLRVFSKTVKK
ncbi:MAG TPA: VCBS repeat-containing protein [Cyclobacteriaceae bacterium]|nr:VCBS repeat-containing protein [Cyclobacteriaceae bacterium]